jgi:hypothetical protein
MTNVAELVTDEDLTKAVNKRWEYSIPDLDWALHQLLITWCEGDLDPWDLIKLLSGPGFKRPRGGEAVGAWWDAHVSSPGALEKVLSGPGFDAMRLFVAICTEHDDDEAS